MRALIPPLDTWERKIFLLCVAASVAVHAGFVWFAAPRQERQAEAAPVSALAERYAQAVNRATDLDHGQKSRLTAVLERVPARSWSLGELGQTVQWVSKDLGFPVKDADVVRALDAQRSREGRWDLRVWLEWGEDRDAADLLALAFLAGEGTLKSDFGSHRLWVHLVTRDGEGRVAFETMDCRLYRAGRMEASDLLHRSAWFQP
ncbi:MAG: hypothetical protein ACNA8S_02390 [Deferrisomatales bacterium]